MRTHSSPNYLLDCVALFLTQENAVLAVCNQMKHCRNDCLSKGLLIVAITVQIYM